jgi:glycerophosphoryl diester phosphodiesterase
MDAVFAAMEGRPERIIYLDEKGAPPEMMAKMAKKYGVEKQIYYTSPDFRLLSRWSDCVPGGKGMVWLGTWPRDNSTKSVAKADRFLEKTLREMENARWKGVSQVQIHVRTDLTKKDPFCPSTACIKKAIELLHANGITVQAFTWTHGDDKDVLKKLWNLGFDNFATDDPLVLFELLPQLREAAQTAVRHGT